MIININCSVVFGARTTLTMREIIDSGIIQIPVNCMQDTNGERYIGFIQTFPLDDTATRIPIPINEWSKNALAMKDTLEFVFPNEQFEWGMWVIPNIEVEYGSY